MLKGEMKAVIISKVNLQVYFLAEEKESLIYYSCYIWITNQDAYFNINSS